MNKSGGHCLSLSFLLSQQHWAQVIILSYLKHFFHLSASVTQQLSQLTGRFFLVFYIWPVELWECPTACFGVLFSFYNHPPPSDHFQSHNFKFIIIYFIPLTFPHIVACLLDVHTSILNRYLTFNISKSEPLFPGSKCLFS